MGLPSKKQPVKLGRKKFPKEYNPAKAAVLDCGQKWREFGYFRGLHQHRGSAGGVVREVPRPAGDVLAAQSRVRSREGWARFIPLGK